MSRTDDLTRLREALDRLYEEAGVGRPSVERRIAPLAELIGAYSVATRELPNLTRETALAALRLELGDEIELAEAPGSQDRLAGFLYAVPGYGCLFVERRDPVSRRRFSAAHELGHYVLHFRPVLESASSAEDLVPRAALDAFPWQDPDRRREADLLGSIRLPAGEGPQGAEPSAAELERLEREANRFAAELLMPEDLVRDLYLFYTPEFRRDDLVSRLAADLLVSHAAMARRLADLGLGTAPARGN